VARKIKKLQESPTLERALQLCAGIALPDLRVLREALDVLIEEREISEMTPDERAARLREGREPGERGSRGYIEEKTINNCGPYLYLRLRRDGKHRSFYLGKSKKNKIV
jgi:hypothetical protein